MAILIDEDFNTDKGGFSYRDDTFRGTSEPAYAKPKWSDANGVGDSRALLVKLGDVDDVLISGMSGAWERSFTLNDPTELTLTFYYKLDIGSTYEQGEDAQALVSLDGALLLYGGNDHIAELLGGATTVSTDTVTLNLGTVAAGTHTLAFGGYSTGKDAGDELTKVFFDNILLEGSGPGGNAAPTIISSAAPSMAENQILAVDVQTDDEDTEGAGLTYSKTGGIDAPLFTLDAVSGELRFLTAPDFETPGDDNGDNVYEVQVTVTDSGDPALTDVQDIQVTVTDVAENGTSDDHR